MEQVRNDEIDINKLLHTIKKHKWIVLIVTFIITAAGIVYSISTTPVYEVTGIVDLGSIPLLRGKHYSPIEEIYKIKNRFMGNNKYPKLVSASNPKDTNLVELRVKGYSIKNARALLNRIGKTIVTERNSIILKYKHLLTSSEKAIDKEKQNMLSREHYIKHLLAGEISPSKNKPSSSTGLLIALIKNRMENDLNGITQTISRLNLEKLKIDQDILRIIPAHFSSTTKATIVKPNKKLIITLSLLIGFITGVLLSLIVDTLKEKNYT